MNSNLTQQQATARVDRLSRLREAGLRINESLGINAVLQEVIDSARSLTDARYGALVSFDDSSGLEDIVISGMTPEERRRLGPLPQGLGLLGYLSEIREPMRLADISSHPRSVGFPENHPPMKTFLGAPVRHLGEPVGSIYLTEKEGGRQFTPEDEDALVMFASQAAMTIANAKIHKAEQQARADLETLINISPVGVLVFDAKTGDLVSFNEETRRIVGKLDAPGRSLNQLLEVLALRSMDGRDIPPDELPTAKALRSGETVLADEVVIHLPDGRAITTLINARPVYREDGETVSVVATIQDITSLEEMKRQRTEFLGMVSHELRTPLSAIKGSAVTMLGSPNTLDPTESRQFLRIIDEQADHMRFLINDLVDMTHIQAGILSVTPKPTDIENLMEQAREAFHHEGSGSIVQVDVAPDLPLVMADRQRMFRVISTLLTNASEGSPESSTISVSVSPEDGYVTVSVEDENRGAPGGGFPHLFNEFLRTNDQAMGRRNGRDGLDLAICKGIVEAHGGRMSVESEGKGRGGGFIFTLPVVDEVSHIVQTGSTRSTAHSPKSGGGQARILVVDDDRDSRRYIRNTLSESGFMPVVTSSPDEAERLVEVEQPHLVLMDLMVPWPDGFELMERLREISDAPVIVLSGQGSVEDQHKCPPN